MEKKVGKEKETDFLISDEEKKGFCKRLDSIIPNRGLSKFALNTGFAESTIRALTKGSQPKLDSLIAIANEAGVTVEWLATGRGPKHYTSSNDGYSDSMSTEAAEIKSPYSRQFWDEQTCDEFDYINLYNAHVSMGGGAWNDEEHVICKLAFRKDWLQHESLDSSMCAAIVARGDSMEGTIKDGATLLVNRADTDIAQDGIYVMMFDGHLLAKRLQRSFDGSVMIKSDNKAYSDIVVPKERVEELRLIGRVAWFGSTL